MADGLLIRLVLGEFGSPYSMFMNLINQAVKKTIIDTVFIFLLTKEQELQYWSSCFCDN